MPTELELLQKIVENTKNDSSLHIAFVAGGAALLGAIIPAIGSYFTVRSQLQFERKKLHAAVVTAERLRWLQELRSKVAGFFADLELQLSHLRRPVTATQQEAYQQLLDGLSQQITVQSNSILLTLNRERREQAALRDSIDASLAFVLACFERKTLQATSIDVSKFESLKRSAFDALEEIGKKAWEKVQSLE